MINIIIYYRRFFCFVLICKRHKRMIVLAGASQAEIEAVAPVMTEEGAVPAAVAGEHAAIFACPEIGVEGGVMGSAFRQSHIPSAIIAVSA